MFVNQKQFLFLSGVIAILSLSACNGIFEEIYDAPQPEDTKIYGFVSVDDATHMGRIYIDATDYTEWHYVDLHGKQAITVAVGEEAPEQWDLAVHRYDAKTTGGAVMESAAAGFSMLSAINTIPAEAFVSDKWTTDKITVDMSQMMDGIIRYAEDWYNPVLSGWLHVDTSTMPPIYTLSGKVYLLRLADGTFAALRLMNFMNDAAVKGFITIDYLYPVQP